MTNHYQFSYLLGTLSVGMFWVACYLARPDLRKLMLRISVVFGIGGVLSEFIYVSDWWHPTTLTGTVIGIEDFMFGFFFSGTVATCYEVVMNKTLQFGGEHKNRYRFRYIALSVLLVFFGSTLLFDIHSFAATLLAFGLCTLWILVLRSDLIFNSVFSALAGCLLALVFFGVPEWITPGWVSATWAFDRLSGYFIFYVPMEDFFWFLLAGAFIGPLIKFRKNYQSRPRTAE